MGRGLEFEEMLEILEAALTRIPEHRRGKNTRYEIANAALGAFGVFFMQSPSFLAYQRDMEKSKGRNNAQSLFGVRKIPTDGQIRNLLDPVEPALLGEAFWEIYARLVESGQWEGYRGIGGTQLISLDGSQYFSSQKIHCDNCRVVVQDEQAHYAHQVLVAVLCAPGREHVICLEPEFILRQDGHEKQDCEQRAMKRWVERHAGRFAPWSVTILADDLHSHQPLCEHLLEHKMHFIMTCKPKSHPGLYEEVALLGKLEDGISSRTERRWNGRYHEQYIYRWVEEVPLRRGSDALRVQWCELTVVREDTGKEVSHNAWITDHAVNEETVAEVVAAGRSRWKVENEGFNVLKNQGYNFEHNYGHGSQNLSAVLLTLLLLAFLFHTALGLGDRIYQAVRSELVVRRTFFNDLRALTRYIYFSSWEQLLNFMYQGLEIEPG